MTSRILKKPFFILFLAAALALLSGTLYAADSFECAPQGQVEKEITKEAQLVEFSCFMKRFEGKEVVHFKVKLKNVSDKPQRFRVNIFCDNGKAVGGLIPRKTKKGLVAPGKSASFVYPVGGMTERPGQISLIVKTMGQ